MVADADTNAGSAGALSTATNGDFASYTGGAAVTTYCSAYSFNDAESTTTDKCKLMLDAASGVTAGTGTSSMCATLDTVADFATKQASVATTYAAVNSHADVVTEMDAQAALEKAWLEAWYLQQYWSELKTELTTSTSGSKAETFSGLVTTLGATTSDNTSVIGATALATSADNELTAATTQLATLQAATAAATATVTELGKRILRAGAELADLDGLANTGGTGTLDAAAALRTTDSDDYAAGARQAAIDELAAANAAVAAESSAGAADGGALTEARRTRQTEWTQAGTALDEAQ